MINEPKPSKGIDEFSKEIKEASIRKPNPKSKPLTQTMQRTDFLMCDPPEVILQNVEKNKMYEVPVKIYNISKKTKSVNIKHPHGLFKVDTDKKNKRSEIAPGMHLEILVIFETDQNLLEDQFDQIIINSENDFKLTLDLKAYLPQPLVQFEPLINLGFVPVNTKKMETIQFLNDGALACRIELKFETKTNELELDRETIDLPAYNPKIPEEKRKQCVTVKFEPTDTQNLHERIEVKQISMNDTMGSKTKDLGYIEIIATSVHQQMSIVFEEGGGPQTDINFGQLYYGQKKECSAFLVNNGPREMSYKFFFHPNKNRKFFNNNYDDDDFACTPEDAGLEMTQRILSAEPVMGFVKPYSQIPIKFLCNTKIKESLKGWRVTLCPEYDINNKDKPKNLRDQLAKTEHFESVAAVKFEEAFINKISAKDTEEDFCKTISVYMEVKAIFPDLTIDKTSLNFRDCNIKEKRIISIIITNMNQELPIDFNFNKIPHFTVEPSKGIIKPSPSNSVFSQMTVEVIFHPQNIGRFADVLVMKYVNNMYEIPIRIFGVCKGDPKSKKTKAEEDMRKTEMDLYVPDELALDFTTKKCKPIDQNTKIQRLHDHRIAEVYEKIQKTDEHKGGSVSGGSATMNEQDIKQMQSNEHIKNFEEKFKVYTEIFNHKEKTNAELKKMQAERKYKQTHLFISEPTGKEIASEEMMKLPGNRLDSPRLKLPDPKDTLWVVKPVGKYEPVFLEENIQKTIGKMADDLPELNDNKHDSSKTGEIPRTHQEIRECNMELTGEDLQKIQVSAKELNMGSVFKNSERWQTFWVKNNHRNHIFVKLEIDSNMPDLSRTTPKSHVIGPGELQGFKVTVFSSVLRKGPYPIKYTFNYKHTFRLRVNAEIILVRLEILSSLNKFQFKNDKLDKEKVDMCVTQKLKLSNEGNADAVINWDDTKEKAFKIVPSNAVIPSKREMDISVIFNPFESVIQKEKYVDELKMNIVNGEAIKFPVEGLVSFCNVKFFNLPNDTIDFEMVHTGVPKVKTFSLKNETNRVVTAYQIQNPTPEILQFKEVAGYLTGNAKNIDVIITHKDPLCDYYAEVPILIRGGQKLLLKLMANIVQPEVFIIQDMFDFGGVSFNEPTTRLLTFKNNSKLSANVIVNLNNDNRYRDFKLVLPEKSKLEKGMYIHPLEKEKKEDVYDEEDEENEEEEHHDDNDDMNKTEDLREFKVEIPSGETIDFDFIYCPNNFDENLTDLETNFRLEGASDEYKGLRKKIKAQKMDSVVTISEINVVFDKTFIYDGSKNFNVKEIQISNVLHTKSLKWEFILTKEFLEEGIFSVIDKKGELPPHSMCDIHLRFTPQTRKEYKAQLQLQVIDSDGNITTKTIRLEGEGLVPRLYFDKRELILPIVPLGFESTIKFKIKNDGYENEEITSEFATYPQGLLPLELIWHEKNHNVGYQKNELKCELKFVSNKPITFTTTLIFKDKEGNKFPIQVAGSCDNCLFTNYSFFQRTERDSIEFIMDKETNAINLKKVQQQRDDTENDIKDDDKKSEKNESSFQGSSTAKNSTVLLGYTKVNKQSIDQNCKFIKRYLKKIHLDEKYKQNNKFKQFPEDVIKDNGEVIYILIKNLTGKDAPGKPNVIETDLNKRVKQQREQFYQLLRYLQENGACLNTVFPEYLLEFNSYKRYIANDTERQRVLDPHWEKSKSLYYQWFYYHRESWVLLVYQILKVFYLARVNMKNFQQVIKHLPPDCQSRNTINRFGASNIYSTAEYLLLKWTNACFEAINPHLQRESKTFSESFSDSALLTALVLSYFPKEERSLPKRNKTSNDLKMATYSNLLNILKDYGIYTHVKNLQISPTSNPNAREMVLFLTMLFQNFQHFYPKSTIFFSCILGDSVIKAITLTNPTMKPLEYAVKSEGNECFTHPLGVTDIKIEPGKEYEYPITFKSKFSSVVEGKVYFINRKPGWTSQAAPIVYSLASKITDRRSIDTKIISTPLYNQFAYKLQVKIPFPKEKGEFEIKLEQQKKPAAVKKRGKMINSKQSSNELTYRVFFLKGEEDGKPTVKFNSPDGTAEVLIFFLPVEMETYECKVIFIKESVGEFQYSIEGRVEKPIAKKAETFEQSCNVDEIKEFDLEIKMKNYYLESAIQQLKPLESETKKGSAKNLSHLLPSSDKLTFSVESNKPYYIVPPTLYPGSSPEPPRERTQQASQQIATKNDPMNTSISQTSNNNTSGMKSDVLWLKVKFQSKVCMVYEGDITLTNLDKPNDIRVYKLYVDVKPKVIRATLEFFCPVKEVIVQKIPIDNKSDKDWVIKGELTGPTNGFFRHETDKRIPKHTITDYLLTFAPTEKSNCSGILKLSNNFTAETYFYTLIGNVEDPLAEGNIEITNISAKETMKRNIAIENPSDRDIPYTVETDLDEVISGVNTFIVKAGQIYNYEMKVRPLLGKIYFGRIIFRDDRKNYKWFTVRVEAKSQIQPQTIEMRTKIRKGIFIDINLENPTNESAIFRIDFDADLFLFGKKDIQIEPNSNQDYQLLFAPLKVGQWDNVMLHIYNDRIGEFLYKLKLISEEQPPIVSELIKAELGKSNDYAIMLENPTYDEIEVKYFNSNPKQFQILQEKILLPSGVNKEIWVRYTPSSLESDEECILKFETKTIGKWEYHLRGRGFPPTAMGVTTVKTYVGGVTSGQVDFKNPLNESIPISIELKCDEYPGTFDLIQQRKGKINIGPFKSTNIPFTFKPQILTKYTAEIIVYISKSLFWKYPIEGITEVKSKGIDFVFKTKAKKMFETKIFLDLSSLPDNEIDYNDFTYNLTIKEKKYDPLIHKCLSINFVDKKNMETVDIQKQRLPLDIKFYPLRPFKTDIEFSLKKKSGGVWIYNVILEATEPEPDDVIHIKSSLGKQSFVAFKLQNIFTKDAKFIAYFSHDSTSEFSVTPREGTLDQSGRDGSQFVICYLPVEYGKIKIGKLIIETDEVQWIFEVRGTHLDYKPPEVKSTNILKTTKATENRMLGNEELMKKKANKK